MNLLKIISVASLLVSLSAFADEDHADHKDHKGHKHSNVESMVKEGKSSRRKKVEMCHDCGKPEVNCDCPEEVKKKEQEAKKAAGKQ